MCAETSNSIQETCNPVSCPSNRREYFGCICVQNSMHNVLEESLGGRERQLEIEEK